ncbi:Molybdopterin molybdotransferase [Methylocella tundrae]|uniref:Molybdopterin molybdenumtransferase n=1 Tax=Methylocella tundrae TaxID=227605 RepID=A0A8B6M3Z7_METTU|nr:gephyrin-like molybdotransferase Glp [Methylocella tundrae]VTZ26387.1 Molybdopterin molybdenumtransferase [Methylocella tundrae]VTZ49505.1 Molybdopterin molybdotransferase [Methylocella tundrae]
MAQLSKDSFAADDRLMTVDEAVAAIFARMPCIEDVEPVSLIEAEGRVLAQDLIAPRDLPGFDNSAVDGFAVCFDDLAPAVETVLDLGGRAAAGHALAITDCRTAAGFAGKAVRIFTGAAMPEGMDTVFMQEDCRRISDGRVSLPPGLSRGANRRLRGEDISVGETALRAGRRLRPEDLGLAAALGFDRLGVRRRLKVAIFSTGDEIVSPGEPLKPSAVYDANRFLLQGLLRRQGVSVTDLGVLADDTAEIRAAIRAAAREHDLVLTSGGVSMGEEDHVKAAICDEGALVFWRLAIKPGRPVAMGVIEGVPFVGLPGNPVAVFIAFAFIARPLIAALSGAEFEPERRFPVKSGFAYKKKAGRREYVRVVVLTDSTGALVAEKYGVEGAAVLTSLTRTHGLVELPEDVVKVAPGDVINFIDYDLIR